VQELLSVDNAAWKSELPLIEDHYAFIGERLPDELRHQLEVLQQRLGA
jgi:phosphoenolpyruvate carboxykinase (GTP)